MTLAEKTPKEGPAAEKTPMPECAAPDKGAPGDVAPGDGPGPDQRLKLFVSTPFRARGISAAFPGAVFGAGDAVKEAYVEALIAEIEAAAEGMDELIVDEVEFGGGPAGSLAGAQLARVMRAVRKSYRLAPDVRIHLHEVPGGVTVDYAGFCKNEHVEWVELEVLSTDVAALKGLGLPPSLDLTVSCFQVAYFTGAPTMGILLDASVGPDLRAFRRSVIETLARSPLYVRAVRLDDERRASLKELCEARGLRRLPGDVWAREGFAGLPGDVPNQLGFGLGAESRFDGIRFKTTDDLALYCAHGRDFGAIAQQVG